MSSALGGSTWIGEIGRDWEGKEMGWDEVRLKRESEEIRREAQGLGDLLRSFNAGDDTRRLIREAEAALGRMVEKEATEEGGARDNAMGADMTEGESTRRLVEQAYPPQQIEDAGREEEPARTIQEAMELEPVGIDLRPRVVVEREVMEFDEDEEWRRRVRGGSRRLV